MEKKKGMITVVIVFGILLLSGCGIKKPISAAKLANDSVIVDYFNSNGYQNIISVEMEKRQTNKDDKIDYMFCQIITENEKLRKIGEYKIISNFYDEGGWIVDEIIELSYHFEPIAAPDIIDVIDFEYNFDGVQTELVTWPLEGSQDENYALIKYYKLVEYPNFDVEQHYNLTACFDTSYGIWESTENVSDYNKYLNCNFEGKYIYEPSSFDDCSYDINIYNFNNESMAAILKVGAVVKYVDVFESILYTYMLGQQGGTSVSAYDVPNLRKYIRDMVYKDFNSSYNSLGNIEEAFNLPNGQPALLFVTQCSGGFSDDSPLKSQHHNVNVYFLVGANKCCLGVITKGNSLEYNILTLSKE